MKKALFTMFIFGIFAMVAFSSRASAQSFWYGYGNGYYDNSYYNYNSYNNYNNYSSCSYYISCGSIYTYQPQYSYYNSYQPYYQTPYYGYGGGMSFGLTFFFGR